MKELLKKEISLVLHPTNWLFLALSALVLVPNYPYYVTFFYTGLGIFFLCLSGRENKDLEYTVALPVEKRDVVRARILVALLLEAAQVLLVGLFVAVSQRALKQNLVGMDANLSLWGCLCLCWGCLTPYFRAVFQKSRQGGKSVRDRKHRDSRIHGGRRNLCTPFLLYGTSWIRLTRSTLRQSSSRCFGAGGVCCADRYHVKEVGKEF
ncbi:MAG: ABC-2 transporter permease [Christensenellaceae bacterium]